MSGFNVQLQRAGVLEWMSQQMAGCGGKTAGIGISGGKDSSTVAALAAAAYGRERVYGVLLLLGVRGIPIGAASGAVDVLFGRVLLAVSAVRAAHVMPLLLFLAPIGVAIVWAYAKYGGISG